MSVQNSSSSSTSTSAICANCGQELIYSVPRQETDTTTKAKIDAGYYLCKTCAAERHQRRKQDSEKKKHLKKQKQDNIKQLEETKVQTFDRLWRDVDENDIPLSTVDDEKFEIVSLPEWRRLMEIYKRHSIRASKAGYTSLEEVKVIKRDQIQNIAHGAMQQKQEIQNAIVHEEISKETGKQKLAEVEKWKKAEINRLVAYVNRLHKKANKEEELKPNPEMMVKTPDYRDPEGNKALRWHLLSDVLTYNKLHIVNERLLEGIRRRDTLQAQIADRNQKRIFDSDSEAQGQNQQ